MSFPDINSLKKQPEILLGDRPGVLFGPGPGEGILLQPLHPQAEAVILPVKDLDDIPASVAKQEQTPVERIRSHEILNDGG